VKSNSKATSKKLRREVSYKSRRNRQPCDNRRETDDFGDGGATRPTGVAVTC
jgi:hypothetical protein